MLAARSLAFRVCLGVMNVRILLPQRRRAVRIAWDHRRTVWRVPKTQTNETAFLLFLLLLLPLLFRLGVYLLPYTQYTAFLWLLLETITNTNVVPPSFKPDREIECIVDKDLSEATNRIRDTLANTGER